MTLRHWNAALLAVAVIVLPAVAQAASMVVNP
jgi:hypothetical protein